MVYVPLFIRGVYWHWSTCVCFETAWLIVLYASIISHDYIHNVQLSLRGSENVTIHISAHHSITQISYERVSGSPPLCHLCSNCLHSIEWVCHPDFDLLSKLRQLSRLDGWPNECKDLGLHCVSVPGFNIRPAQARFLDEIRRVQLPVYKISVLQLPKYHTNIMHYCRHIGSINWTIRIVHGKVLRSVQLIGIGSFARLYHRILSHISVTRQWLGWNAWHEIQISKRLIYKTGLIYILFSLFIFILH